MSFMKMRSHQSRVGLKPNNCVLSKKEETGQRRTQAQCHVKMKADVRVRLP